MKKLLVIIPDHLSALIQKGEIVENYYNPGNLFEEVHILMTNNDQPDAKDVQKMVGTARLFLHNLPQPNHFFRNTLGWQPLLMKSWVLDALILVERIKPSLVRTHCAFLEGYLAATIKEKMDIPYVVSLHGIWYEDQDDWKSKLHGIFRKKLEFITFKNADAVIGVYSALVEYAKIFGASKPLLIYNFVGGSNILSKKEWNLSVPPKIITINRQLPKKNPTNIIKALALLPFKVDYTLIGDGVLHEDLKLLVCGLGLKEQVKFIKALPNKDVCKLLKASDILVSNCHYKGISKSIIEASLVALPTIINKYKDGYMLSEYKGGWIEECEDSPEGYMVAITKLIYDNSYRSDLGKKAYEKSLKDFNPNMLENKVVNLYKNLLNN